jgi:hypothetical protein
MSKPATIEAAILVDDLGTLDELLATPTEITPAQAVPDEDSDSAPVKALKFSALKTRPLSFQHILETYGLRSELSDRSVLLNAIDGGVPIWKIILEHAPSAKNYRFGHYGSVVERCIMWGEEELLTFLLENGAQVEREGGIPALKRAELCDASEGIKAVLRKHGARTEWTDSEAEEDEKDEE